MTIADPSATVLSVRALNRALEIEPLDPLTAGRRAELSDEGERLLDFVAADSKTHAVRLAAPS